MPKRFKSYQRSLPYEHWPELDKADWQAAFLDGALLYDNGPLAKWSERTRLKAQKNYGHWLSFLDIQGLLEPNCLPADRITQDTVQAYLDQIMARLAVTTCFMRIVDLSALAQAFAPDRDWEWLKVVRRRLEARLKLKMNKVPRMVHTQRLWKLGLALIEKAEASQKLSPRTKAMVYRDGLLIALLAARPLRMKNLTHLELDRTLIKVGGTYLIDIPAQDTKTKRALTFNIPSELVAHFDAYLALHRPALLKGLKTNRLWISLDGTIAKQHTLSHAIRSRTKKAFGHVINPHLFRDCAATSLALNDPETVRAAAALLGHANLATTTEYYDHSKNFQATKLQQRTLIQLRDRLRQHHQTSPIPPEGH